MFDVSYLRKVESIALQVMSKPNVEIYVRRLLEKASSNRKFPSHPGFRSCPGALIKRCMIIKIICVTAC